MYHAIRTSCTSWMLSHEAKINKQRARGSVASHVLFEETLSIKRAFATRGVV
ncbi:hypothetical protein C8Q80DRAFT_1170555 [Daedaleopsis nitida]|nr:hypothetical protein C8Q80DRAFT_1170555 [Daedaleopsis nitida]